MKNRFSRLNGVETVSNMSQSVRNIITSDQKHILDLNKSHKDRLKKSSSNPPPKKNSQMWSSSENAYSKKCPQEQKTGFLTVLDEF